MLTDLIQLYLDRLAYFFFYAGQHMTEMSIIELANGVVVVSVVVVVMVVVGTVGVLLLVLLGRGLFVVRVGNRADQG